MTSLVQSVETQSGVAGLVFLGFPLHAPNRPGDKRAAHLRECGVPMLFLQGTRDALADLELMRGVVAGLGDDVTLHVVDDADHSFKVPKRSGRSGQDVMKELATTIATWTRDIVR